MIVASFVLSIIAFVLSSIVFINSFLDSIVLFHDRIVRYREFRQPQTNSNGEEYTLGVFEAMQMSVQGHRRMDYQEIKLKRILDKSGFWDKLLNGKT